MVLKRGGGSRYERAKCESFVKEKGRSKRCGLVSSEKRRYVCTVLYTNIVRWRDGDSSRLWMVVPMYYVVTGVGW